MSKTKVYLTPIVLMLLMYVIIFLPAGSFRFWQGWIWWLGFSILTVFITAYFMKKSPELLMRRTKIKEKETTRRPPAWLNLYFLAFVIPGLDFHFHWSLCPFGLSLQRMLLFSWAIFLLPSFLRKIVMLQLSSRLSKNNKLSQQDPIP